MIAALFVAKNGAYYGIQGVDPWDESRDARTYQGPHRVVAHPPCSAWCQLAHVNQKRYGHKVGDDGGCFASALASVLQFGGVLEHPAFSYAWKAYGLARPVRGTWTRGEGYWVTEVDQGSYGHPARKRTWLLYVGPEKPPAMCWDVCKEPSAQVSFCKNHGNSTLPRLSKKAAKATPPRFRDALIDLAER